MFANWDALFYQIMKFGTHNIPSVAMTAVKCTAKIQAEPVTDNPRTTLLATFSTI